MKKTDLTKRLRLTPQEQDAIGIVGVDLAKGPDKAVVAWVPVHCKHRVSLRELEQYKPRRLGDIIATAHACLNCGEVRWRLHPGPVRIREPRESEEL
jgi:hypothetical protein